MVPACVAGRPLASSAAVAALLAFLFLGAARPGPASAGSHKKVPDAPYGAEFQARVRLAIARGIVHLRTRQVEGIPEAPAAGQPTSRPLSENAFEAAAAVAWVLRRGGLADDLGVIGACLARVRSRPARTVHEAGLLLLALCAVPLAEGNPFSLEERGGGASSAAHEPATLEPADLALARATVDLLLARQIGLPGGPRPEPGEERFHVGGWDSFDADRPGEPPSADLPATCFALLGLEAARRRGLEIPTAHHLAALTLLLSAQAPEGPPLKLALDRVLGREREEWTEVAQARGWGYGAALSAEPTGQHTTAGALGLSLCQDALQGERAFTRALAKQTQAGLRDGLAWVQQHYDVARNPVVGRGGAGSAVEGPLFLHHWRLGLSRLLIHARQRFVGAHDWYQEGAEALLAAQRPDGSWDEIWWANCYSLLFLLRASLASVAPVVTPGGR